MEAGNPTKFISNVSILTSKPFTDYTIFKSLVQAFFPALNNSFNIGTYQRTYMPIYLRWANIGR